MQRMHTVKIPGGALFLQSMTRYSNFNSKPVLPDPE